jgi:hypothetical protein
MTDRDKLWAFLALLGSILTLALVTITISRFVPGLPDSSFKVADSAMTILGTAFGAAALALFRTSQAQNDMASALKTQAETQAATTPQPAAILQPGEAAVAAPAAPQEN